MHIKDTVQGAPSSMANDVVALWTMVSRSEYSMSRCASVAKCILVE